MKQLFCILFVLVAAFSSCQIRKPNEMAVAPATIITERSMQTTEGDNEMQNENTKETRVTLTIGDTVIPATLNNTVTARAFIERLPFTVSASKAEYDFCGTAKELACDDSERQAGWKNGDIGYSNGWFALFHSGEEQSGSYTTEMIIGHIDDEYLGTVRGLSGRIEITVAQADE
ncbi:MAG: hypothetical protein LBB68_00185 [Treponema sp.]|jgi:hypothetical protein|nr:hypothetical protein [Treponema sp.]